MRSTPHQTAEKRHVFKRGYGVLAYSKEIKQEKIALTIRDRPKFCVNLQNKV